MHTRNWRSISLPKRPIAPLMHTYSAEFHRIRRQVARLMTLPTVAEVRQHREIVQLRDERPARVMNQRQRLNVAYWAGWTPFGAAKRVGPGGTWGPAWIGGRP